MKQKASLAHVGNPTALSEDIKRRRAAAMHGGIASTTIEGGSGSPEAQAVMHDWAQGIISHEESIRRIKALHLPPAT